MSSIISQEMAENPVLVDGMPLVDQLIATYGPLLLDTNLIFAIVLAWAITAFAKQSPMITETTPVEARRFKTRAISAVIGFFCVVFMKWDSLDANLEEVIQLGILVAFTHGFIYTALFAVIYKVSPATAELLKGKSK